MGEEERREEVKKVCRSEGTEIKPPKTILVQSHFGPELGWISLVPRLCSVVETARFVSLPNKVEIETKHFTVANYLLYLIAIHK